MLRLMDRQIRTPRLRQYQFAEQVDAIRFIQSQQSTTLAQAESAFDALIDQNFHQEVA
ncbi:MAG: hypothetical protein HQM00_16210 [Magnetococcales bacterium]|nr:hypothetical protein [Magnetococcales bacterium]